MLYEVITGCGKKDKDSSVSSSAPEGKDFKRIVTCSNLKERMVLATAIANPSRLYRYLPSYNFV